MYVCVYIYIYEYCILPVSRDGRQRRGTLGVTAIYIYIYIYIYICVYVCIYIHMYMCKYMCIYMYIHICIYIYIERERDM